MREITAKISSFKLPLLNRRVVGHSMVPVLPPGTKVWGYKWFRNLKPGDVVIFLQDGKEKIKRISEMKDNEVYVLGDHPETSIDSRQFGWLPIESVKAKIIWPRTKIQAE